MASAAGTDLKQPKLNFKYVSVTSGGRIVRGDIKATSEIAAQNALVERGRTPISIEEASAFWSIERQFPSLYKCCQSAEVGHFETREDYCYEECRASSLRVLL